MFCLAAFCITALFALGGKEKEAKKNAQEIPEFSLDFNDQPPGNLGEVRSVQVKGIVRLVGTGLFNDLVISGEHEWYIAKEDRDKLHNLQHRTVTVEAEETARELRFANGMSAGIRRELRNIKIISME